MKEKRPTLLRKLLLGVILFLVYAYAIQEVNIDLRVPQEVTRQTNLVNLLRQMARPDVFTYSFETESGNLSLRSPCPEVVRGSQITYNGRTITLTPNCVETTQETLTFSGTGYPPYARGVLRWHPPGENVVPRLLANVRADEQGNFSVRFTMPDVRESEEAQRIEIEEILDSEISGFSGAAKETWARILETVLMALIASTLATIVAVPIAFVAARNLMASITAPLAAIMLAVAALPLAAYLARLVSGQLISRSAALTSQATWLGALLLLVALALMWAVLRLGKPAATDGSQPLGTRLVSYGRILLALLLGLLSLALLAHLGLVAGNWLGEKLGAVSFLGTFVVVMSDLLRVMFPALLSLAAISFALSWGNRYGEEAISRLPDSAAKVVTALITGLGTAVLVYGIGSMLNWFYAFDNVQNWTTIPALVAAVLFGLASLTVPAKRPIAIGLTLYALLRGSLNLLRAIEPIILGIVFVAWVGLGPFAGILALTLNSIADLGKLFSEQVENIDQGPVEAVNSTGASRLQTIVYAVIPQIVPPFIAFSFYRWDINVRMSTIIGFVGGGGVGVTLLHYTNLLQYRQAAVIIIAIALVVGLLDYVSSELRKRLI